MGSDSTKELLSTPAALRAAPCEADLACLSAARGCGLVRRESLVHRPLCPLSALPTVGWYAAANWDRRDPDLRRGGPWAWEQISSLAARGLIGVDLEGTRAEITKAGRALLKAALSGRPAEDGQLRDAPK